MEFTDIFKALQDKSYLSEVLNEVDVFNEITAQYNHVSRPKKYDMSRLNDILIDTVSTNHETGLVVVHTEEETAEFFLSDIYEGMSADSALCAIQTDRSIEVSKH